MTMFTNTNRLMYLQSRYLSLNKKEFVNFKKFQLIFVYVFFFSFVSGARSILYLLFRASSVLYLVSEERHVIYLV